MCVSETFRFLTTTNEMEEGRYAKGVNMFDQFTSTGEELSLRKYHRSLNCAILVFFHANLTPGDQHAVDIFNNIRYVLCTSKLNVAISVWATNCLNDFIV